MLGKPVTNIMPELIKENHENFRKRFMEEGNPTLLGRVRNEFVKDFKGFVMPVQFFLNFYYN